ncbi:MAG: hypothetical protein P8L77_03255 [Gammaproteobacteria bacterium]|nr:hypothetical protein [Gammaproteobacteria bacterium]
MSKKIQTNYALDRLPSVEQAYNLFSIIRLSQANFRAIYNQISIHCFDFNSDQTCSSIIKFLFKLELLIILGVSIVFSTYSVFTSPKSLKLYLNKHINMFQYVYILYMNGNLKNLIENNEFIYKQLKTHSIDFIELENLNSEAINALGNHYIQELFINGNLSFNQVQVLNKKTIDALNDINIRHLFENGSIAFEQLKDYVPHHSLNNQIVFPQSKKIVFHRPTKTFFPRQTKTFFPRQTKTFPQMQRNEETLSSPESLPSNT